MSSGAAARRQEPCRRKLLRDDRGTTAVEFAVIAMPLLLLLIGSVVSAASIMVWGMFDAATKSAGREIQIGHIRSNTDSAVRTFICGQLGGITADCTSALMIYAGSGASFSTIPVATVSGTTLSPTSYSTSTNGSLVVLQVAYRTPFGIPFSSVGAFMLTSTTVFRNEP